MHSIHAVYNTVFSLYYTHVDYFASNNCIRVLNRDEIKCFKKILFNSSHIDTLYPLAQSDFKFYSFSTLFHSYTNMIPVTKKKQFGYLLLLICMKINWYFIVPKYNIIWMIMVVKCEQNLKENGSKKQKKTGYISHFIKMWNKFEERFIQFSHF